MPPADPNPLTARGSGGAAADAPSKLLGRRPVLQFKLRSRIMCVAFAEGLMFAGGNVNGEICIVDAATGSLLDVMTGHREAVSCLCVAHGRLWSGSSDRTIRLWSFSEAEEGARFRCVATLKECKQCVTRLARCGHLVFAAYDDPTIHGYNATRLAQMKDGDIKELERLSKPHCSLSGHTASVTCIAASQGKLWSASNDGTVRVWDPGSRSCLRSLSTGLHGVWGMAISPRRNWVICSGVGGTVHVFDSEGHRAKELRGHTQMVRDVLLWDQKDVLFSCSKDETIRVWSLGRGELIETFFGHEKSVNCLSLYGCRLHSGSHDKQVLVWDLQDLLGSLTPQHTQLQLDESARGPDDSGCCAIL
eukprot:TRINITY_DN7626_c1_g1_i1.p1 TRINITY_DN7626_c1_g1~~TRINITY_DN7626_c1_g1_i1.p1  ORF type:complete len:362 (+),score=104.81 TRINITY_DN7626_c1_g1_i1:84-1169(+)